MRELNEKVLNYLKNSEKENLELLEELAQIPAPSGDEMRRAEFVKKWLDNRGAKGVYIDDAKNVVYPVNCDGKKDITVFTAHTDVVFPDTVPLPFKKDGEYMYCPGIGDDTACLTSLLTVINYAIENELTAPCGVLFVANSGEEGLGNLKGIRQIMKDYAGRISAVYSFDGNYGYIVNKCVGSHRYEVTFETEGGHSFCSFGNRNAIAAMSKVITELYKCKLPEKADAKTTFNVGVVNGGTSVNAIAQKATMLFEYRSDDKDCLKYMKNFFTGEIEKARSENLADITVKLVGYRPCGGDVDPAALKKITDEVIAVCEKYSGMKCIEESGSTDCNIPMSLGVPSVCVGSHISTGAHTREEKLLIKSIPVGLKITAEIVLNFFAPET